MSGENDFHPSEKTEVIHGSENVLNAVKEFASNTKTKIDVCLDHTRPSLIFEIGPINKLFAGVKGRGIHLRVLTEITADNISSCKKLIDLVDDLRHLDGIKGTFYTSETEYLVPAIFHEEGKAASQMIYTNVRDLVEQQQYIFDTLWNRSISAEEKIKEIEEGIQPHFIQTIHDSCQLQKLAQKLCKSAREEVLILYSTANAFLRQWKIASDENALWALREVVSRYGARIRILTPPSDSIKQLVEEYRQYAKIRYIPESLQTKVTITVFDNKSSFIVEIKDDTKNTSYEAMGLGTYSNSTSTVSSYVSIFETLWRQSELYAEGELSNMKEYLNEVLKEIHTVRNSSFKNS